MFDPKGFTVLPPTITEGGGRNPHITINIIHEAPRPQTKTKRWAAAIFLWLIVFAILAMGYAQLRYEHWTDTNGWHGEIRQDGRTTNWTEYTRDGKTHACHRYYVGDQAYTECN